MTRSLDDKLARIVGSSWQTAGQIQRLYGGEAHEIANALERLWRAGRLDRETQDIGIGAKRKGGGASLRRIRYRRKQRAL